MDSILSNPEYDFLKQFYNDNDNDDVNDVSPHLYDDLSSLCKYYDKSELINACKSKNKLFLSINAQSVNLKNSFMF
jgi:hypothetical protein